MPWTEVRGRLSQSQTSATTVTTATEMEKFPATLRSPTPSVSTRSDETEESSSTSTQETEENQATTDDTQHPSNVSDDPGTSNFWEGARAQSVLEILGVPSQDIALLLNALPLSAFDKLFSGDPPPLRVTFHPDDKRPMLAWWNGALSDSTLEALVDVCRGLRLARTYHVSEVFADVLLNIARQPDTSSAARGRLLKWCSRLDRYRATIDLSLDHSFALLCDCKQLLAQKQLPERECHELLYRLLYRLVDVGDASEYKKLSPKEQVKLTRTLVNVFLDKANRQTSLWDQEDWEKLTQHIADLHARARDANDESSAMKALVLLQALQRSAGQGKAARILGTFKELVGQVGEQRADKKFRDRGRAIERSIIISNSEDGLIATPVPGGPPLVPTRLRTYLKASTEGTLRMPARNMVAYLSYGREHFKHVFTPGVICSLWLAHAHINPHKGDQILKWILSTGGVPLGKAFDDLAEWFAQKSEGHFAKQLFQILEGKKAEQLPLVVQISILRAMVGLNHLVDPASNADNLGSGLLRPFCEAFLISTMMSDRLQAMLRIMYPATSQGPRDMYTMLHPRAPSAVFGDWIGIARECQTLFHNDDRWPPLHAQLTHAMLAHVLVRDIKGVYPALLRLARERLLPGIGESMHARVASFLSQALADEEVDEAQLRNWAESQVNVLTLVLLMPDKRHRAHKTLGAFHAAKSLATGSDSMCEASEIAEVYKYVFLFEIHAADGDHPGAVHHLELAVRTYISGRKHWGDRAAKYAAAAGSSTSQGAQHILEFCSDPEQPGFMFDPDRQLIKVLRRCLKTIRKIHLEDDETQDVVARLLSHELE